MSNPNIYQNSKPETKQFKQRTQFVWLGGGHFKRACLDKSAWHVYSKPQKTKLFLKKPLEPLNTGF